MAEPLSDCNLRSRLSRQADLGKALVLLWRCLSTKCMCAFHLCLQFILIHFSLWLLSSVDLLAVTEPCAAQIGVMFECVCEGKTKKVRNECLFACVCVWLHVWRDNCTDLISKGIYYASSATLCKHL